MNYFVYQARNNEKLALYSLIVFTFIIRSIYVLIIYINSGTTIWGDDWYYLSMGEQLANGNWSPKSVDERNMVVGPGIPILIALFIKLFNNPIPPFFLYNIIASTFIAPVMYYLGKEIFNNKIGWLLAIWSALNIEFFKYTPHILKETTVCLFVPLTLLLLIKSLKSHSYVRYLLFSALSFIFLIHTDERFFFYLPFFILIFLLKRPTEFRRVLQSIGIWIGLIFLLLLPWTIRNYKVFNQVVLISPRTTSFTSKVWGENISGINPLNNLTSGNSTTGGIVIGADKFEEKKNIPSSETNGIQLYLKTFKNIWQPTYFKAKYVQYSWWSEARIQKWSLRHNLISLAFYGVFLPFYLGGLVLLIIKLNPIGLFLGILPVIHSILHTIMLMPEERYRYPIVFIIVMIGFWAATKLFEELKTKCNKKPGNNTKMTDAYYFRHT